MGTGWEGGAGPRRACTFPPPSPPGCPLLRSASLQEVSAPRRSAPQLLDGKRSGQQRAGSCLVEDQLSSLGSPRASCMAVVPELLPPGWALRDLAVLGGWSSFSELAPGTAPGSECWRKAGGWISFLSLCPLISQTLVIKHETLLESQDQGVRPAGLAQTLLGIARVGFFFPPKLQRCWNPVATEMERGRKGFHPAASSPCSSSTNPCRQGCSEGCAVVSPCQTWQSPRSAQAPCCPFGVAPRGPRLTGTCP